MVKHISLMLCGYQAFVIRLRGKPDIELVDMSSRLRTVDGMDVTKPIIFDADTGA